MSRLIYYLKHKVIELRPFPDVSRHLSLLPTLSSHPVFPTIYVSTIVMELVYLRGYGYHRMRTMALVLRTAALVMRTTAPVLQGFE